MTVPKQAKPQITQIEIPNPQISSAPRSSVTTWIEVPHQSRTQKHLQINCSSLTTQPKTIFKSTAFHGFKLDVIEWKLEEKGPSSMLLLGETRCGRFVDTWQPWKKVLRLSKLLGKVVSLFVMFLNFWVFNFGSTSGSFSFQSCFNLAIPFSLSLTQNLFS